ncbi:MULTISPECIES: Wzz/FepE/Etk N-terminal domain-containing protein [Halorhodospira]|uniref:Wzz/FepE/Etk N-terminal domain-containing protein n=1 Tax=Halorhodospira TaxID=85108 RepID=UPI001EE810AF|nr:MULTISPECIES: Wzz/FepE/Etk N-terminal domain-containing protein [Halorhodospira]MCG5527177.1 Wzz/FepE/Etk N-terminal domain-containing protein [Halorhodospira halophila]MCG5543479.1 Wzz/FepE/Etk N-terminal domain-containing protein [Halorhodospira sp. 9628]
MNEQNTPGTRPPSHRGDANFPEESRRVPDDEISLIDLWLVLVRRRWWLFGIALIVFALGTTYALLQKPSQAYTTTLEFAAKDEEPLISSDAVMARLERVVLPELKRRFEAEHEVGAPSIELTHVEGSRLLILESSVSEDRLPRVEALHGAVRDWFLSSQDSAYDRNRSRFERDLEQVEERLASEVSGIEEDLAATRDELERARAERERLQEARGRLQEDLEDENLAEQSEDLLRIRLEAVREDLSMANSEVRELQRVISELRTERRETVQELSIDKAELEDRLADLQAPDAPATAAEGDIQDAGASLIMALSAVLGGMLGIFGAFFREFLAHAHQAAARTGLEGE